MTKTLAAIAAFGLLSVLSQDALAQVAGDLGTFECRAVQTGAQTAVTNGGPYRNHGMLVRTAAKIVDTALAGSTITESCSSCIVRQFARSTPVALQEPCGADAVCGDGICTIGEDFYSCPTDCGGDTVVGVSLRPIPRTDACGALDGRTCESLIGDVIQDATRSTYAVDFALINSGGIRAALTCPEVDVPGDFCPPYTPPPYPITRGQVFTVLPFGNKIVTLSINGAELKAMLENGVSAMPVRSGRFPQVSGMCFTYDISAPVGSRVLSAVRQVVDGSCTGGAIDLTSGASYVIAENDFMLTGGDGYPDFQGRETVQGNLDQVVSDWLIAVSPIAPTIQGRISCTTSGATACPVFTP